MSRAGDEKRRENAEVGKTEKTWTEKSKKWLTNGGGGCIIFLVSGASVLRAKPNSGDLHSGSAVDSDSTCGSSILSSPTRTKPSEETQVAFLFALFCAAQRFRMPSALLWAFSAEGLF